jgi:hypothetical protein
VAAIAALVLAIPLAALAGRRLGRRARGNLALAGILLGLGEPFDPPKRHLAEAGESKRGDPAAGDPPEPEAS